MAAIHERATRKRLQRGELCNHVWLRARRHYLAAYRTWQRREAQRLASEIPGVTTADQLEAPR